MENDDIKKFDSKNVTYNFTKSSSGLQRTINENSAGDTFLYNDYEIPLSDEISDDILQYDVPKIKISVSWQRSKPPLQIICFFLLLINLSKFYLRLYS